MSRRAEFGARVKEAALQRQKHCCASCGEQISTTKSGGASTHKYGEPAHAHHIVHAQQGGSNQPENCVILCWSCHYCAHEGGNFKSKDVMATKADFPHYDG